MIEKPPKIRTAAEAQQALEVYIPRKSGPYHLANMRSLMSLLGNPQNRLRVVHVAGTSGKTSTSYFIRALLERSGRRTGLTVSPHVHTLTERFQLDGMPIGEDLFVTELNEFLHIVSDAELTPTYFEALVGFAYWAFDRAKVDYAIVETGLGGLLDGTNVVERLDKVCVLTDIGLDHTEILGNTTIEIAEQKAGIVHAGNHVLAIEQDAEVVRVFERRAQSVGATLQLVSHHSVSAIESPLPPFQLRNWSLARATYAHLRDRDGLAVLTQNDESWAVAQIPPGRLQILNLPTAQTLVLDGAHNPQKLAALMRALEDLEIRSVAALYSLVRAPEQKILESLRTILPYVGHLIIPNFSVVQDTQKESVPAAEMAEYARRVGFDSIETHNTPHDAFMSLLARNEKNLVVTGSIYLLSQIMPWLPQI